MKKLPLFQSAVERLLYLIVLLIFIGIGLAAYVLGAQIHNQTQTTVEIKAAVENLKRDKASRDKVILDHLDCIAFFLSQRNRAEVRIGDLQGCRITGVGQP